MYRELALGDFAPRFKDSSHTAEAVFAFLEETVENILVEIAPVIAEYEADPRRSLLKLPLIRIKV